MSMKWCQYYVHGSICCCLHVRRRWRLHRRREPPPPHGECLCSPQMMPAPRLLHNAAAATLGRDVEAPGRIQQASASLRQVRKTIWQLRTIPCSQEIPLGKKFAIEPCRPKAVPSLPSFPREKAN